MDRRDARQEGDRTGGMQDRRETGQEGGRTVERQDWRETGQEGCRTLSMKDSMGAGYDLDDSNFCTCYLVAKSSKIVRDPKH